MTDSNEVKTLRLRSTVRQIYGGRLLMPGDRFPAPVPEYTARRLIAGHFASEDLSQPATRTYVRRDHSHSSEPSPPLTPEEETRPQRSTPRRSAYSRKDQEAEE